MQRSSGRTWLGLILVIIGGLLVFDNLNFVHFSLFSWPVILIVVGVVMLANSRNSNAGVILIAIGGLFLSSRVFGFDVGDIISDFWPIALILLGLLLLVKRKDGCYSAPFHNRTENLDGSVKDEIDDTIDVTSAFNDVKIHVTSQNFKGGKATASFGAIEIDLRDANLADGSYIIDMVAVFGGITLRVPSDWDIQINVTSILGGFEDKRRKSPNMVPNPSKKLILQGTVTFGGGQIN